MNLPYLLQYTWKMRQQTYYTILLTVVINVLKSFYNGYSIQGGETILFIVILNGLYIERNCERLKFKSVLVPKRLYIYI